MDASAENKINQNDPLSRTATKEDILRRVQTAESVWLPRDVFETLYLNPEKKVAGDLRARVCSTAQSRGAEA